jgi:hypothetical protein
MPATPPFQDWLKDAVATLEALQEGQRVANGPDPVMVKATW